MNIDEARFKVLEQNIQALTQAVYKLVYSLSDLRLLLAQNKVLVHPKEKSDIPNHSLFAQVKLFLEKEGLESAEEIVHTEPQKTCKVCKRNYDRIMGPPLVCLGSTACTCPNCETKRRRPSYTGGGKNPPVPPGCTGDYYGAF